MGVHKYFGGRLERFTSSTSKKVDPLFTGCNNPPSENMLEKMLQRTRVNERHLGIEDSDFQKIFKDTEMYITI